MISTYDNDLFTSVFLWAQHWYLQTLQAYTTITTPLYYSPDSTLPSNCYAYAAPIKQWVYDSGVAGAVVINSASGGDFSTYPLTRDSGIHVDYVNSRVIVPSSFGTGLTLSGTYSYCQVNIYQSEENEEGILTQNKYFLNPRYRAPLTAGVPPYIPATPAIFVNPLSMNNAPFEFGGIVNSKTTMSLTMLTETSFQLTALLSTFRDTAEGYFPLVGVANDPLDEWNDVKGGTGYNYLTLAAQFGTPGNLVYVERTHTAKVSDGVKLNPRQFAGIVDLDLSFVRLPPALT